MRTEMVLRSMWFKLKQNMYENSQSVYGIMHILFYIGVGYDVTVDINITITIPMLLST